MKAKYLLLIFLITSLGVLSCSDEEVEPVGEVSTDVLIPFSDTFTVSRKRTVYSGGNVDDSFNIESRIKTTTTFDGQKWYGYSDDAVVFFTNKPDGVHILYRPLERQSLIYKYPAIDNDSYTTFTFQGSGRDVDAFDEDNITNFEIITMETNATLTLPSTGETFTGLIHFRKPVTTASTKGDIAPADWFFKPGIGAVYFASYTDNTLTTLQLEEEFLEIISN